jgi:pullulanase/glycogen debranching enzyme
LAGWNATEGAILSLGAEWIEEERAYNFSLCSEHAERVTLLLFGEDDPAQPLLEHRLDPRVNKTWHVWHCRLVVEMVFGARYYAYEIDGPRSSGPLAWHAFDPQKVLLDPYAKAVYRDWVLPLDVRARVSVEQASVFGWAKYVGRHGQSIGMRSFGASAPLKDLQREFGFTVERVVEAAKDQIQRAMV